MPGPHWTDFKRCTPLCSTHILPGRSLRCKYYTVTRYTSKCTYLIYVHKKSTTFPTSIFMKRTNAQQYYVQFSSTEFLPNRTISVESKDSDSQTTPSKVGLSLLRFSQNWHTISRDHFLTVLYLSFNVNNFVLCRLFTVLLISTFHALHHTTDVG
jgi:hypothetical protein